MARQLAGPAPTADLVDACGEDPSAICRWVFEASGQVLLAELADWFFGAPLRILVILVVAIGVNVGVRRAIGRFGRRVEAVAAQHDAERRGGALLGVDERAAQRASTVTTVLRSIATVIILTMALLMVLGEAGVNVGPLVASAGIVGVALGFGAQNLVKDFLSGLSMVVEDQFGVGDVIDVGEATGVVEKVSLRITTLRSIDGTLWHVPNGEIQRVGNMSQRWARALLDVDVAYGEDVRRAQEVIKEVADALLRDREFGPALQEEPEVLGVEELGADSVTVRVMIKTAPAEQWRVQRELRLRIKEAFDAEGIEIPFPQRTVWLRTEQG